jgi:hypothetical protein
MILNSKKEKRPDGAVAKSWADVAGKLGISRQALYNWRKLEDAPQEPNVDAWLQWAAEHKPDANQDLQEVKRLVELEKLRKLKRENEIQEERTIEMDEVTAALRVATAKWDSVLTSKLDQEAPARLVGKDIAEMRAELAAIHDELREAMARELGEQCVKS